MQWAGVAVGAAAAVPEGAAGAAGAVRAKSMAHSRGSFNKTYGCNTFESRRLANPPFSALFRRLSLQTRRFPHFQARFEVENCCNLRFCRN